MDSAEPIPAIPLEYAKPAPLARRSWAIVAQVALVLAALDVLVGWMLIGLVDAETVLATAPILFALGITLLIAGWRLKWLNVAVLGLAHCSICLLFTMLVNVRNWSPDESTLPFMIMAGAYLLFVTLPMTGLALQRLRSLTASVETLAPPPNLSSAGGVAEDKP